ncbi:MAG: hypothetical protein K6E75_14205 [Lachnospiraceae bacterium]|nr:hypothetical protein [Lachnospiraceae bacterium]
MDRNRIFSDDLTSIISNEEKLPAVIFDYPQLNPAGGIKYCGDAEDYMFALETYADSIDDRAKQIETGLQENDIDSFIKGERKTHYPRVVGYKRP